MAFVVTNCGFGFIKGLTVSFQSQSQDICNAYYNEVDNVKSALREVRDSVDYKKWYDAAVTLGETVNTSPSIPHRYAHQIDVMYQVTLLKRIGEQLPSFFWMKSFHIWILVLLRHNWL